ncbi:MAG: thiamine pyrophosphate-dependent dehydrogenase E1 component subunit alpha [Candidatus Binatia bacterium]|nr:thiamine pyrophosphate-dependent dehydrogenase E1 component subunit alpha [Candidatus Binatia bacterium]
MHDGMSSPAEELARLGAKRAKGLPESSDPDSLGALADPEYGNEPCDLSLLTREEAQLALERMILIRAAEEQVADGVKDGSIRCPCHLAIGQEATAMGVALNVKKDDRVFGAHRSHAHYLSLGCDLDALFDEIHGRESGCSHGMGGSMHLRDVENGLYGTVPIVAATVPIASGSALAAKMDGRGSVAISYFGDGATEEGVVHETLNLASVMGLPLLFVCENNFFSSHLHIHARQPADSTCRFAEAHGITWFRVDGNDLAEVKRVSAEAFELARTNQPVYLELVTYRWRGHVGYREDLDVGVRRGGDVTLWKRRDPIRRLASAMVAADRLKPSDLDRICNETRQRVAASWQRASKAPHPAEGELLARVWSAKDSRKGANS